MSTGYEHGHFVVCVFWLINVVAWWVFDFVIGDWTMPGAIAVNSGAKGNKMLMVLNAANMPFLYKVSALLPVQTLGRRTVSVLDWRVDEFGGLKNFSLHLFSLAGLTLMKFFKKFFEVLLSFHFLFFPFLFPFLRCFLPSFRGWGQVTISFDFLTLVPWRTLTRQESADAKPF